MMEEKKRQSFMYVCIYICMYLLFFWPCRMTCGILVSQPGIEHRPLAVSMQSPNHWTTREFPRQGFFLNKSIYFIYLFLAALGLRCCMQALPSCGERGPLFTVVCGLLVAVASLVAEHGLQVCGLQQLWHMGSVVMAHGLQSSGSVVVVHGLSCSTACGIIPDQGLNLCPLHWQADS